MGAVIGYSIGAMVGGILDQYMFGEETHVKGPRLADLKHQTSSYGGDIPKIWGTMRISGNVIHAEDIVEKRKIRHLDGDAEFWEYSYYCTFAVALCEGPIVGVKKIFLDNKLYSDMSGNVGRDNIVSNELLHFTVYPGSTSQGIDPVLDATNPGNIPAYRRVAYIVFNELPLKNYGNRIPNVSVEVVATGLTTDEAWQFSLPYSNLRGITLTSDLDLVTLRGSGGVYKIAVHNGVSDEVVATYTLPATPLYDCVDIATWNDDLYILIWNTNVSRNLIYKMRGISGTVHKGVLFGGIGEIFKSLTIYNTKFYVGGYVPGGNEIREYTASNTFTGLYLNKTIDCLSTSGECWGLSFDEDGNIMEADFSGNKIRRHVLFSSVSKDEVNIASIGYQNARGVYFERNFKWMVVLNSSGLGANRIYVHDDFSTTIKETTTIESSDEYLSQIVIDICGDSGLVKSLLDYTHL
jgi:hypothetical protein